MRIGGGRFRGRQILVPKDRKTRPTSGRLKKTLFDIIGRELPEARVLDLFAGAGALGLEALSRGAARVVFVERGRLAAQAIEKNLDKLGASGQAELLRCGAPSAVELLADRGDRFELILLDPPYRSELYESVLARIAHMNILVSRGCVVVEHHHKRELAEGFGGLRRTRQVRAGESCLSFYR